MKGRQWLWAVAALVFAGCGQGDVRRESTPTTSVPAATTSTTITVATTDPPTSTPAPTTDGWAVLDPGPLSPRFGETQVWTGSELLIWGGVTPEVGEPLDDGAAYDPATGTWRLLPSSNGAALDGSGVWTGTELVVVNTQSVSALDPVTGQWRSLFSASVGGVYVERAVLDGSRLLVFTENRSDGAYSLWASDLSTGGWSSVRTDLATAPASWLWTGHQLIDPYGYDTEGESGGVVLSTYDVESDVWSMSTGPPIDSGFGSFAAIGSDGRVFIWDDAYRSPEESDMEPPFDRGLAFDPESGDWTEIAGVDASRWECSANSAAAGPLVFVEICGAKFWLDPDLGTLADIQWSEPVAGVDTYPTVTPAWTGAELLFWGQPFCYACEEVLVPRFASLVPPAP